MRKRFVVILLGFLLISVSKPTGGQEMGVPIGSSRSYEVIQALRYSFSDFPPQYPSVYHIGKYHDENLRVPIGGQFTLTYEEEVEDVLVNAGDFDVTRSIGYMRVDYNGSTGTMEFYADSFDFLIYKPVIENVRAQRDDVTTTSDRWTTTFSYGVLRADGYENTYTYDTRTGWLLHMLEIRVGRYNETTELQMVNPPRQLPVSANYVPHVVFSLIVMTLMPQLSGNYRNVKNSFR